MGFGLTILYLLTYYLTPRTIFGSLADYHIQLILAIVLVFVSIPSLTGSTPLWKTPQSVAVIGLAVASFMSYVVGQSWIGGGFPAILRFLPNAFAFLLLCLHCNSKKKVQIVILLMLFVCLFVIGQGAIELHRGLPTGRLDPDVNMASSYFLGMSNDANQWFYRLRGMGEINDPNDFAQVIVTVLPLLFVFWKPKNFVRNFFVVLVPVGILLWGDFLTHSRGSLLALLAIVIMAFRRRIGTIRSVMLAAALFAAASALHFAGGRDISASAGEDRTALWGDGMQILKSHPLFGVGYGLMPDYTDINQTAHNSIVVCAAELGLFGLYFWSMFLLPSVRDAVLISTADKSGGAIGGPSPPRALTESPTNTPTFRQDDIVKFGQLLVLSFTGFLVAGWFLSRAYVLTMFLLGGLTEAVYELAPQLQITRPRLGTLRVMRYSVVMTIGLVLTVYIMLRILNLTH